MKISVLGLGMWGFCLARHLSLNGHTVTGWTNEPALFDTLVKGNNHPHLPLSCQGLPLRLVRTMEEAVFDTELIVESVTTKGLRPVLEDLKKQTGTLSTPLVLTSKGIEQNSHLIPPDVVKDVFGEEVLSNVAMISGPSFAVEVARHLPTAVVCGGTDSVMCEQIVKTFSSNTFRVYPNQDIRGVAFGGALKNIIAIACGVADGMGLGTGAMAALVTRGLHEMVKLGGAESCKPQTFYGLSGLGDLYLTCSSPLSRNFSFGRLLSQGLTQKEAEKQIGMVVEGAYTCIAAQELGVQHGIPMPITEAVCDMLVGHLEAQQAVARLMQRNVKEECL